MRDLLEEALNISNNKHFQQSAGQGKLGWKLNNEGKRKMAVLTRQAIATAQMVAKYTAEEIAAVAVDLMVEGIDKGALSILADVQKDKSAGKGFFAMEEGANGATFKLENADATLQNKRIIFPSKNDGRFGIFFEEFFYGLSGGKNRREASFPDLSSVGEKYSEIISYLAPEIKTSSNEGMDVGGQTVAASNVTYLAEGSEKFTTSKPEVSFMKDGRRVKPYKTGKQIEEIVEKFTTEYKVEVDDFTKTAVGLIKLLQKIAALLVIETDKGHTDGKIRIFQYKSAKVFAQLNVPAILKGLNFKKSNIPFVSINVENTKISTPNSLKDVTDITNYGQFSIKVGSVNVKISSIKSNQAYINVNERMYRDEFSIWDNPEQRDMFFKAMYELNRTNGFFAVAQKGSPQEAYNNTLGLQGAKNNQGLMRGTYYAPKNKP